MTNTTDPDAPGKPDSQAKPKLDSRYLEEAWKLHLSSRQGFTRDLTIALVALLLLSVNFTRSVALIEEYETVDAGVADTYDHEEAFKNNLTNRLALLPLTYHFGYQRLASFIHDVPCAAQERLAATQSGIQETQPGVDVANPIRRENDCSESIGVPIPSDLWSSLTAKEQKWLVDVDRNDPALALRTTDPKVLDLMEVALQRRKDEALDLPIERVVAILKDEVSRQRRALIQAGTDDDLGPVLNTVWGSLGKVTTGIDEAPLSLLSDGAQETIEGATIIQPRNASVERQPVENVEVPLRQLAAIPTYVEKSTDLDLSNVLAEVESVMIAARSSEPDANQLWVVRSELKKKLDAISSIYAGPLPGGSISLSAIDTVRLFPIVLLLVLALFAWRFARIVQRAAELDTALETQGFDDVERRLFLPSLTRVGPAGEGPWTNRVATLATGSLGIAFFLGLVIAVYAVLTALRVKEVTGGGPQLLVLYALAGIVVLWSCIVLAFELQMRRTHGTSAFPDQVFAAGTALPFSIGSNRLGGRLRPALSASGMALRVMVAVIVAILLFGLLVLFRNSVGAATFDVPCATRQLAPGEPRPARLAILRQEDHKSLGASFPIPEPSAEYETISPQGETRRVGFQERLYRPAEADPNLRKLLGTELALCIGLDEYEGEALSIRWSMSSTTDDSSPLGPFFEDQPTYPTSVIVPPPKLAATEPKVFKVWIPDPAFLGDYSITVTLFKGTEYVASEVSEPISVGNTDEGQA